MFGLLRRKNKNKKKQSIWLRLIQDFRVDRWLNIKSHRDSIRNIHNMVTDHMVSDQSTNGSARVDFADYKKRFGLTEQRIQFIAWRSRVTSWVLSLLSLAAIAYGIYQFSVGHYFGVFLCFVLLCLFGVHAFTQNIAYYRYKNQNFNIHFKQWWSLVIGGFVS